MKRRVWLATSVLFLLSLPTAFGQVTDDEDEKAYQQLDVFGYVFEKVRANYVEPIPDRQLIDAAIRGMVSSLDPHSNYLDLQEWNEMQEQTKGEFAGLGIDVTMENGLIKVVSPMDGAPAAKAGLRAGDLIVEIDGKPVLGLTIDQAVDKMRGPVGSRITLTIRRSSRAPFDVTLVRAEIKIPSVSGQLINNVGYVRISEFSEQTRGGVQDAVAKIKSQAGKKLIGLVLDLRDNPGGLLDEAVAVSDDFVDRGEIVSVRGRDPDQDSRYNATQGDLIPGLPMVVLINGGLASASEIVGGALQDHHRAILLGTRSFGKGSVQTIDPMPGGGALRLTTARYYTPSGRSIQVKGIEPDIEVEQAKVEDIASAQFRSEADLPRALQNTGGTAPDESNNKNSGTTPSQSAPPAAQEEDSEMPRPGEDYQLARALDLLHGIELYNTNKAD